jgi:hypothetical protein
MRNAGMAHKHHEDDGQSTSAAYETRDVKLRPLVVFTAGLVVAGLVIYFVVFLLIRLFTSQAARQDAELAPTSIERPDAPGEERLPPEPRIQANPEADLQALRAREDAVLTTYGWVDREAGVVRVPIDVAMSQVLRAGLPVRQPDSVPPASRMPAGSKAQQGAARKVSK